MATFRDQASTIYSFYLNKLKTTHTEYYERQTSSPVPLKVSVGSCPRQLTVCNRGRQGIYNHGIGVIQLISSHWWLFVGGFHVPAQGELHISRLEIFK